MALIGIVAAVGVLAVAFFGVYRPRHLRWGATREDLVREMPGDEIVRRPIFNATRVVTVNALPEDIWPWIVQIGFGRAGWYSIDLFDNLGRHSSERIVPEVQHIEIGGLVPLGPRGGLRGVRERVRRELVDPLVDGKGRSDTVGLGLLSDSRRSHSIGDPGS